MATAMATEVRTDEQIQRDVLAELKWEPRVSPNEIGVVVKDGVVALTGWVDSYTPSLAFLDPWGYKGLSRELIHSLLKDWGCEVMFFFNFNRVNMHITNEAVTKHMQALFGPPRLATLRAAVDDLAGPMRARAVMAAVDEMVREAGGQFVLPFRFVAGGAERTSHYLIFVTKHFLGCKIIRDVMAKASSYAIDGVASFEYRSKPQLFLTDGRSVEALAESLASDLAGTVMPEPAAEVRARL